MNWSSKFAYAVGLITTDGNLSKDGRHIEITSKDEEQLLNFLSCLNLQNKIGKKRSGSGREYSRVQFSDVVLYRFLLQIGLMPNKSKIVKDIKVPKKYIFDFLRGHFDGDGSFYSYKDPRWKNSFMFYTSFTSASPEHIQWLRSMLYNSLSIQGHITKSNSHSAYQLKYAKRESLKLLPKLYYDKEVVCLSRKRLKIAKILGW